MALIPDPLPLDVVDAIQRGSAIEAIKLLRASTGLDLKQAKEVVEQRLRRRPVAATKAAAPGSLQKAVANALRTDDSEAALRALREKMRQGVEAAKAAVGSSASKATAATNGLAPGEVPKSSNRLWLVAVFIAVVLLLRLVFGRSG